MADILITILQAMQLVGLFPCLAVILFLALAAQDITKSIVPILYFTVLASSFLLPLSELFHWHKIKIVMGALYFLETLAPALSYLFIIQFVEGRIPRWTHWLILALPVIGGSGLIYGIMIAEDICFAPTMCISTESAKTLYNIFAACLIFLLLTISFGQSGIRIASHDMNRKHKYWLIMALIMLNLQLLIVDLAWLGDRVAYKDAALVATIIRFTFIYLVLTSLFRVFDKVFELDYKKIPSAKRVTLRSDEPLLEKMKAAMEDGKLYREPGYTREALADYLGIGVHHLSRILNQRLGRNFNEFINRYRIEEASERLRGEMDCSVTVIAFEVGFSSIASFNRVFKEMVGCSPSEYRAGKKPKPMIS